MKGWPNEPTRHQLASKGIKSKYQYKCKGSPRLTLGMSPYFHERIQHLTNLSNGKEWIAELTILNGEIIIDDIQPSNSIDTSHLHWNTGDESRDVGYIHYHPPEIIPEFSAQDFVLAFNIHSLRNNKGLYPYTIMGLVYPEDNFLKVKLYGVKPGKTRLKQFEGKELVESDMTPIIQDMKKKGELLELKEART